MGNLDISGCFRLLRVVAVACAMIALINGFPFLLCFLVINKAPIGRAGKSISADKERSRIRTTLGSFAIMHQFLFPCVLNLTSHFRMPFRNEYKQGASAKSSQHVHAKLLVSRTKRFIPYYWLL